ncbi:phospholipase D-like domain-containing protein [Prosthecobacter fusiformis]|uniref:phospholipase D-like domain-containing protein n=1 Tax=Prosthecobacter fusiformis TaxID=48464 RepID=UPI001061FE1B|nr:phospholipase D-like domain-containing protein [Prosthecobacter fusiformis]
MTRLFLIAFLCLPLLSSCVATGFQRVSKSPPPVQTPAFAQELSHIAKTPWTEGNAILTLENGGNYFPAMLKAMREAKKTLTFESYVCVDSEPTQRFSQMFAERARAGVRVHVLLDAFGCSKYGEANLKVMRDAGVQLHLYRPMNLLVPWKFIHRTHRRALVADGKVGFMGGAGWAYCWDGHAENVHRWRDTQYELRGPVVAQLQDNFNDNWEELTGHRLTGPDYYPPLAKAGNLKAQMALGSPEKLGDTLGSTYLLAFRAAQKSIVIAHAYFIPNAPLRDALKDALKRGVKVQIIIPGKHIDFPASRSVNTRYLRQLVAAGAELYEFQPTMTHGKLVIVDGHLSIAGSTNLDQRSFFINDENNLNVLDAAFSARQLDMVERDKQRSKRLERADLNLSLGRRFQAAFCRIFEYQM